MSEPSQQPFAPITDRNSRPVRLGVIGLGNIASQHIGNIARGAVDDCTLAATCSRRAPEDTFGVPHFTDANTLIASGLCDAVLIATPTFEHAAMGEAALRAGLHVMMEKPLGLSVGEAETLLAMQGEDQVFALMLNQRTDPLFVAMRDIVASGELGEITRTHWTMTNWFRPEIYFQVSDWRATWAGEGGGLLLNQCIHNLDIFAWLCGMPARVQAFCRFGRHHEIEVEDEVTAYFEYANGASGVFVGSTGEAPGVNRFDIVGDKGALHFDGGKLTLTENTPGTREFNAQTRQMFGMPETSVRDITPDANERADANQHAQILSNFTAAILRGEPLLAPAQDGIDSLALANAMLLATWEQAAVNLPLDSGRYEAALQERVSKSSLREKLSVQAEIDMDASYR